MAAGFSWRVPPLLAVSTVRSWSFPDTLILGAESQQPAAAAHGDIGFLSTYLGANRASVPPTPLPTDCQQIKRCRSTLVDAVCKGPEPSAVITFNGLPS